jgi:peptide/nickel transport system substrate-binding protein
MAQRTVAEDPPRGGARGAQGRQSAGADGADDADLSVDLPFKDAAEIKKSGAYRLVGTPVENSLQYVGLVTKGSRSTMCAYARRSPGVPYEEIYRSVVYDLCIPMSGGPDDRPALAAWPQPFPYKRDMETAKALLSEAGYAGGFETAISIDLGDATQSEPTQCCCRARSPSGIKTRIEKIPGANLRNAMLEKNRAIHIASFGGWLNFPDYYFYWGYHGQNALFNTMSYQNPALDKLVDPARFEEDRETYAVRAISRRWPPALRRPLGCRAIARHSSIAMRES